MTKVQGPGLTYRVLSYCVAGFFGLCSLGTSVGLCIQVAVNML